MRSFRVDDHEVGVRVGDRDHELTLSVNGLRGDLFAPSGDRERVVEAMRVILAGIGVEDVHQMLVELRLLVPLRGEYDKVRSATGAALLRQMLGSGGVKDWALLLDRESRLPNTLIKYEFGIVSRAEIPLRLAGVVGQVGGTAVDHEWNSSQFPEVALFIQGWWENSQRLSNGDASDEFPRFWEATLDEAFSVVKEVGGGLDLEDEVVT